MIGRFRSSRSSRVDPVVAARRARTDTRAILALQLPVRRARLVQLVLLAAFAGLGARALYLQGLSDDFLQRQGEARFERTVELPATRGKVLDRNGVLLASSLPARSVWAVPEEVSITPEQRAALARLLDLPPQTLQARLEDADRRFVYLRRQVPVAVAAEVRQLGIPGVFQDAESLRSYPQGEVAAHMLGFTNIDGKGQEGIELAFDNALAGTPGSRRVIRDRLGRIVEEVQAILPPENGRDLHLSIDSRIQYLAYNELRETIARNQAVSGSAVVLDVVTGEVLALANWPSYDPNERQSLTGSALRNRAFTDAFEPGSTMKPFSVALALDQHRVRPDTTFNTYNGRMTFAGHTISDVARRASLNVADILKLSSNIGMTQISERLAARDMWNTFTALGFGQAPTQGFPGVAAGRLRPWERWRPIEKATMSYGYGLSISLVQLARAYTAFGHDGSVVSVSLLRRDTEPTTVPVYTPQAARTVLGMLEAAAEYSKLSVPGYRVAGKSGTARKIVDGQYSRSKYVASYVGLAPVSQPRIVVAVRIDEPGGPVYYGGRVAAPAFAAITSGALRILGVAPDAPIDPLRVAELGGGRP
ncbi:MAG: penicillin-binding protein 2 [Pigmentiphaga sp.]|nr:penicillin-binding protein 2 [Pigmentiphaga sp.]